MPITPTWKTGLSAARDQLKARNFEVNVIDLSIARKIPPDASLLIDVWPQTRFTAAEQQLLRQHLSELGQDLQMLLGRVLGNQQHHQQPDRLTVRGTELDRVLYPDDRCGCPLQSAQAPVRYRDSLAQAGRTELLAGHQAVEDSRRTQSLIMLEYVSCTVQRVALVVRLDVERDVRKRQQVREQIHGRSTPFSSRLHSFEQRTRNRHRGYLRWATVLPLSLPLLPT